MSNRDIIYFVKIVNKHLIVFGTITELYQIIQEKLLAFLY